MRLTLPATISALVSGGYSFASYSAINTPLDFYLITTKGINIELGIESLEQQNKTEKAPLSIDTAFISPSPSINNNQQHELPDSWHTSKENYYSLTFSPDFVQLYTLGQGTSSTSSSSPTPTPQLHSHNLDNLTTLPFADLNEDAPIILSANTQPLPHVPQDPNTVATRTITRTMDWLKAHHQPFYEALQMTLDHYNWHAAYEMTGINFSDEVLTALDTVIQESHGNPERIMNFIYILVRNCHLDLLWKIKNSSWLTSLLRLYLNHPSEMASVINVAESVALHLQATHNLSAQAHNRVVIHMIMLIAQQTEAEHGAFTQLIHTHNPQMAFWISILGDEQMVAMLLGDFTLSASFQRIHQHRVIVNLGTHTSLSGTLLQYLTEYLKLPSGQALLILNAYLHILKNDISMLQRCSVRDIACLGDISDLILDDYFSPMLASQSVAPNRLAALVFNPCLLKMATVLLGILVSQDVEPQVMSEMILPLLLSAPLPINDSTPIDTVSLWGLNILGQTNALPWSQGHIPDHVEMAILAFIVESNIIANEHIHQTMQQIYHLMCLFQQDLLLQESDNLETLKIKIKTFLENLFMGRFTY